MWLRVGVLGYNPDGYCLLANNTLPVMGWEDAQDADLTISGNHLQDGALAITGASETTIGGDVTSIFANPLSGNFEPRGELAANPKSSVLQYDLAGKERAATSPAGALI